MAETRMKKEKDTLMKIFSNIEDHTWPAPYFNLNDELKHLSREEKLCALAHLKAHIASKKAKIDSFWQILGVVASLVALLISLVALYNNSSSPDKITAKVNTSSLSSNETTVEANASPSSEGTKDEANSFLSCLEIIAVIFAFIAALVTIIGGFVRPKQCSINQYVLSIVESLESYYLDSKNDQQAKDTKEGPSVPDTDKT